MTRYRSSPNHIWYLADAEQIFQQLRKPLDPKVVEQREKEISERIQASYEKAEKRQNELVKYGLP